AGEADLLAHLRAVTAHVVAGHPGPAAVRLDQRGQDADGGGLARAVRPEEGEYRARGDLEVDSGQDAHVAVGLGQPGGLDGPAGARLAGARLAGARLAGARL